MRAEAILNYPSESALLPQVFELASASNQVAAHRLIATFRCISISMNPASFAIPLIRRMFASCVAAIAVPTTKKKELFKQFKKLTHGWADKNGEVKGRTLDEDQIASVRSMLQEFDVLLQIAMIDLGLHTEDEITRFKAEQAKKFTWNEAGSDLSQHPMDDSRTAFDLHIRHHA